MNKFAWPAANVVIRLAALFVPMLVVIFLVSRSRETVISSPAQHLLRGETMGTTYSVRFVPKSESSFREIHSAIEAELLLVNQQMSTYLADSEISRFNNSSDLGWIPVSEHTARVVELGQQISTYSEGAFDVTVGPLVDLWGFGPPQTRDRVPAASDIQGALELVGYRKLDVTLTPPALKKTVPGLRVDLSAIAKGHGVDRVGNVLRRFGVKDFFVEIGGEILTAGKRMDGLDWQVGIEAPLENERGLQTVIPLSDAAIATSGDYRNYFEEAGQRYSHTIDPTTGRPIRHALASASVVADNCALADAIATSMMALGPDRGLQLAQQRQWSVMLICREQDHFNIVCSDEFERRFPGLAQVTVKPPEQ